MGVKGLWAVLQDVGLLEQLTGDDASSMRLIAEQLDSKVIAVDLAMWVMQAQEQVALQPHFSPEGAAVKVSFERSLQWLRFGITPVFVVEGRPPDEKAAEQRRRMLARFGWASSGPSRSHGAAFTGLLSRTSGILKALGLPVVYAPGEAEATCAALCLEGAVDAVATFDSDCLLYGAQVVYKKLKLDGKTGSQCQTDKCSMSRVRSYLGIQRGGTRALLLIAALSGCDYESVGAERVGSTGALALVKLLLRGREDDSCLLERFQERVRAPADPHLLTITKCTGCRTCGHEGGHKGKIKAHTKANPCVECGPSNGQQCCVASLNSTRCLCAFHRLTVERQVERVLQLVRKDPELLSRINELVGVFDRQAEEAIEFVRQDLRERDMHPGQVFTWLHRPCFHDVFTEVQRREVSLPWDKATLRGKLLPALLEWDIRAGPQGQASSAEFLPKAVKKVHGSGGEEGQWRYLVVWERLANRDLDNIGTLSVPLQSSRIVSGGGGSDVAPGTIGKAGGVNNAYGVLREEISVEDFDRRWLAHQDTSAHRAARQTTLRALWPEVEDAWVAKSAMKSTVKPRKTTAAGAAGAVAVDTPAAGRTTNNSPTKAAGRRKQQHQPILRDGRGPLDKFFSPQPQSSRAVQTGNKSLLEFVDAPGPSSGYGLLGRTSQKPSRGEDDEHAGGGGGGGSGTSPKTAAAGQPSPPKKQRTPTKLPPTTPLDTKAAMQSPTTMQSMQQMRQLFSWHESAHQRQTPAAAAAAARLLRGSDDPDVRRRGAEVGALLASGSPTGRKERERVVTGRERLDGAPERGTGTDDAEINLVTPPEPKVVNNGAGNVVPGRGLVASRHAGSSVNGRKNKNNTEAEVIDLTQDT